MTARQIYEGVLIELNKVKARSLLLEEFNYLFNKAVLQYINKRYNIYDTNQQTTDDIRVLKSSAILTPVKIPSQKVLGLEKTICGVSTYNPKSIFGATYDFILPADYLHLLNCVCIFKVNKQFKCYDQGTHWEQGAERLTSDMWPQILHNFYMKPSYKKPYYYIHNENSSVSNLYGNTTVFSNIDNSNPTNVVTDDDNTLNSIKFSGTDVTGTGNIVPDSNGVPTKNADGSIKLDGNRLQRTITLNDKTKDDVVERTAGHRYGNASNVRLEIRYGKDDSIFQLESIWVDYLKTPQHIRLTETQIELTEDTSQIMEFPDTVCKEIIDELVHIVMENTSDPRLQTHPVVSQSIANPAQAQTQEKK